MNCPVCETPMNQVCGEDVCGTCYGRNLLTEKMPRFGSKTFQTIVMGDDHGHERLINGPVLTRKEFYRRLYGHDVEYNER